MVSTNHLFASNGLITCANTFAHNCIIGTNFTTYDDCYELFCDVLLSRRFGAIKVKAQQCNSDCNQLEKTNNRKLIAEFDEYHNTTFIKAYYTKNIGCIPFTMQFWEKNYLYKCIQKPLITITKKN